MRPYVKFYRDAGGLSAYDLRTQSAPEILGGTLIANSIPELRRLMELSMPVMVEDRFFHLTLSAPEDVWLDRAAWLRVVDIVLLRMGVPAGLTPYVVVRHANTDCDHIHVYGACFTFSGRMLELLCGAQRTNETHQMIARELGLPVPYYYDAAMGVRLAGHVPQSRLNGDANLERIVVDINTAMEKLPKDFPQLNQFLQKGFIQSAENAYDKQSFRYRNDGQAFFLGCFGQEFEPRAFRARLQQAANIRNALLTLELGAYLKVIANDPALTQQIENHHTQMRKSDTHDERYPHATVADRAGLGTASNSADDSQPASTVARLAERAGRARNRRAQLDQDHLRYSDDDGAEPAIDVRDQGHSLVDQGRAASAIEADPVPDGTAVRGGRRRGPSWIVSVIRLAQSVSRKARYVFRRHVAEIDVHFPDNSAATVAQSGALASTVDQPEGSLADAFKRAWTRQGGLIDAGRTPAAPEDDQDGVTDTEMATSDPSDDFGICAASPRSSRRRCSIILALRAYNSHWALLLRARSMRNWATSVLRSSSR